MFSISFATAIEVSYLFSPASLLTDLPELINSFSRLGDITVFPPTIYIFSSFI